MIGFTQLRRSMLAAFTGLWMLGMLATAQDTRPILRPELGFSLPPGFVATVFHQGIENQRFMAVSSDGVVFVNRKDRGWTGPGIIALKDDDGDGVADRTEGFGGFEGSGIAVRVDDAGQEWLYASSRTEVFRWALRAGELAPSAKPERIAHGFLRQGQEHPWKPLAFDGDGGMYVMVGAPSNACMEKRRTKGSPGQRPCPQLERQSGVWRFDADAPDQHQNDAEHFATGVRNMIAFAWSDRQNGLYGAQHGRDFLNRYFPELFSPLDGAELPSEVFYRIDRGDDLGWPYTYYDHIAGERRVNPEYESEGTPNRGRNRSDEYKPPIYGFPGHWAPSGLVFNEVEDGAHALPERWRNGAFIVFKGGWGRNPHPPQAGHRITFVPLKDGALAGEPEIFASGFAGPRPDDYPDDLPFPTSILDAAYLPLGLTVGPDGAMYLGDVKTYTIWRIVWAGDDIAQAQILAHAARPSTPILQAGRALLARAAQATRAAGPSEAIRIAARDRTTTRPVAPQTLGEAAYVDHCATCHQRNGRGVDGFAPSLAGSGVLAGDPANLAFYTLIGPAPSGLWSNVMPAYRDGPLTDDELAAALNYARAAFTEAEDAVTLDHIAEARAALPPAAAP